VKMPERVTAIFGVVVGKNDEEAEPAVRLMVRKGADPHAKNCLGQSVLFCAITHCQPKTLQLLLELGVDPRQKDELGQSPLSYAEDTGQKMANIIKRHLCL
jgi:ankyrin repeat protein